MFRETRGGRRGRGRGLPESFGEADVRGGRRYRPGEGRGPQAGPGRWEGRGHGPGRGHGRWFDPGRWGRGRVRRGDVRAAILALLAEEPMHGYEIINQLAERSGGMWQPSAGSVYPTLQQLEDEGLVRGEQSEGRNVYTLTEEGKPAAAEATKDGRAPWDMPGATEAASLYGLFLPLGAAVKQVSEVGSPEAVEKARAILVDARRSLYRLLAEDGAETAGNQD